MSAPPPSPAAGAAPGAGEVVVVSTGGTIASTRDERGVSTPSLSGADVLGGAAAAAGVRVRTVEALRADSSTLTLAQVGAVREACAAALADPAVRGVVVLHGTDSMEETAFLLDLHHGDERPVVLTGSQRTADDPASDAPGNVLAALRAAAGARSRGRGVLVAFGGRVLPAAGTVKRHTAALDAFAAPEPALPRGPVLPWPAGAPWPRVDVVAVHPGADGALVDAAVALGARGVVLQALGAGNAAPDVVGAVRRATGAGVAVVVTTRVPEGPVSASYGGGGGGHDLAAAGAAPAGRLRAGQARVLLAVLLRAGADAGRVAAEFRARG
ncbi:asparaginase domain-containing protein [Kineococcus indalonis]|uniref:asparaginase domain-containing protein n=1 Tax=Kineococcus indalonis TaxID=2696566 RepID=UPI00141202C9|nr:asparaginase domain-containing protein [Kineococcus indalonis]NAZ86658.1 asparaginase [Kineococcus indalonis]